MGSGAERFGIMKFAEANWEKRVSGEVVSEVLLELDEKGVDGQKEVRERGRGEVPGTSPARSHSPLWGMRSSSTRARHVFCHFLCESL